MNVLSFRPRFPPGTPIATAAAQLRQQGYRLTLPRFGYLAVRTRNTNPPPRAA